MKTHILCSIIFFFENLVVYEIMSKNMAETEATNDVTIWPIRLTRRLRKATHAHARIHAQAHAHAPGHTHTYALSHSRAHTLTNM